MKKMMKLFAVLFMLASTLVGAMGAKAADDATRPIMGDLTIHKYWLPEGVDPGTNGTGAAGDQIPDDAEKLNGVVFDVYKVGALQTIDGKSPTDIDLTDEEKAEFEKYALIPGGDGVTYKRDGNTVVATMGGKEYVYALGTKATADTEYTDGKTADGKVKYTDLAAGEYFVEENLTASTPTLASGEAVEVNYPTESFVVAVPMTERNGTGTGTTWNTDVHVHPKNKGVNFTKTVDKKDNVKIGDILTYSLIVEVPEKAIAMEIWDILDNGLTLVDYDDTNLIKMEMAATKEGQYTDFPKETNNWQASANKTTEAPITDRLDVDVTSEGIDYIRENDMKFIKVTFKAQVNENAKIVDGEDDLGNVIVNEGKLIIDNEDGSESEEITTPPVVTVLGEIEIKKVDRDDESKLLKGAEFAIARTEAEAKAGQFIKKDANGNYLYPGDTGYATGTVYKVTSDTNGIARFVGLPVNKPDANEPDKNKLWVKEIKAADGDYQLLDQPVEVELKVDWDEVENNADLSAKGVVEKTIHNSQRFVLPKTGSWLTILLTILGIILLGLGIMSSLNKKKESQA